MRLLLSSFNGGVLCEEFTIGFSCIIGGVKGVSFLNGREYKRNVHNAFGKRRPV
jgi:hypothetical protein